MLSIVSYVRYTYTLSGLASKVVPCLLEYLYFENFHGFMPHVTSA